MTLNLQAFWCLCLFDGGAAAAGAGDGGASASAAAGAEGQSGTISAVPAAAQRGKSGEYANVVFGKQDTPAVTEPQAEAPAAEEQTNTEEQPRPLSAKERRKAYDDFVKGEGMKEIDEQRIQGILDRRLRDHKTMQETLQKQAPLMELLAQKYGVTDVEQLTAKLESDNAYWQDAADDAGMDVEQFKRFKKLERQNSALLAQEQARQQDMMAQNQLNEWYREADTMKQMYPDFDLQSECGDPEFISLLKHGIPMEHAYKLRHWDDLMQQNTADTERKVVAGIRSKGMRPQEAGATSQSAAFTVKDDVRKLSKKDRAEVVRRALRGEKISF